MQNRGLITKSEIQVCPMHDFQRDQVIMHLRRLKRTLCRQDEDALGGFTTRDVAREQLAKMTVLMRDHLDKVSRGKWDRDVLKAHRRKTIDGTLDENIESRYEESFESLVQNVVDASFSTGNVRSALYQPALVNKLLEGREEEIAAVKSSINPIRYLEPRVTRPLHTRVNTGKELPDWRSISDIVGQGVEFELNRTRSFTDDDMICHRPSPKARKEVGCQQADMFERKRSGLDRTWPPYDEECIRQPWCWRPCCVPPRSE